MAPVTEAQLVREIDEFEVRAKESAFAFYNLELLFDSHRVVCRYLPKELLAVAALLPTLRRFIVHPWFSTPDTALFTQKQLEILSNSIHQCRVVMDTIDKGVAEANRRLAPGSGYGTKGKEEEFDPYPGNKDEAQGLLEQCFYDLMTALSAARAESLCRRGYLSDDEVFENLRLQDSLKSGMHQRKPDLAISHPMAPPAPPSAPASDPFISPVPSTNVLTPLSTRPPSPSPYQSRDVAVIELQHPKGFRGRYGHPDYPLWNKQPHVQLSPEDPNVRFDTSFEEAEAERHRLAAEGKYPNIGMFGVWPPTFIEPNSIQDRQLKAIMSKRTRDECTEDLPPPPTSSTGTPIATPNTTRASSPAADSDKETVVGEAKAVDTEAESRVELKERSDELTPKLELTLSGNEACVPNPTATSSKEKDAGLVSTPVDESSTKRKAASPLNFGNLPATERKEASHMPHDSTQPTTNAKSTNNRPPSNPFSFGLPTSTGVHPFGKISSHLEAYILRPLCEDVYNAVEWSYNIELLPLADEDIQSHINKPSSDHSVIDAIRDLHTEELRLIRIRAKNRSGQLVSAQHGRPVDLVTKMGTFQVRPVIFVLRTTKLLENDEGDAGVDRVGNRVHPPLFGGAGTTKTTCGGFGGPAISSGSALFDKPTAASGPGGFGSKSATGSAFGGFGINPPPPPPASAFGGFGNNLAPTSAFGGFGGNPAPTSAFSGFRNNPAPASTFGGFGSNQAPTSALNSFGGFGSNPPQPTSGVFTRVGLYRQKLQEKGEPCTYAETTRSSKDEPNNIDHFLSITPLLSKDVSFEELRIADMQAGRTGPWRIYEEKDRSAPNAISRYETMAPYFEKDISFEELRISDTTAGRAGIPNSATNVHPSAVPSSSLGGGGLFGSKPDAISRDENQARFDQFRQQQERLFGPIQSTSGYARAASPLLDPNVASSGGLFPQKSSPAGSAGLFGGASNSPSAFSQTNKPTGLFSQTSSGGLPQPSKVEGLFGRQSADGGVFSNLNRNTSPPSTGLFGTTQPPSSGSGLFGKPASQNISEKGGSPFGGDSSGGLFSNLKQQSSASGTGLFSTAQAPSTGSSFGGDVSGLNSQKPSGLFGNPQGSPSSGLFGSTPSAPSNGLFNKSQAKPSTGAFGGAPCTPASHSTGLFGSTKPATSSSPFSTAPNNKSSSGGGLFSTASPGNSTPSPGLFGAKPSVEQPKPSFFGNSDAYKSRFSTPSKNAGPNIEAKNSRSPGNLFNSAPPAPINPSPSSVLSNRIPPHSTSNLFGSIGSSPATTTSGVTAKNEQSKTAAKPGSWLTTLDRCCKTCSGDLFFHGKAEQQAHLCDDCAGKMDTDCAICKSRAEWKKNLAAPSSSHDKTATGAEAKTTVKPPLFDGPAKTDAVVGGTEPKSDASEGGVELDDGAPQDAPVDVTKKEEKQVDDKQDGGEDVKQEEGLDS